jgi:hypothetical protein
MAFSLSWGTTQSELISGLSRWGTSNQSRTIRFNVQNSSNCGGSTGFTQSGVAAATKLETN